jgi:hypothetical protein
MSGHVFPLIIWFICQTIVDYLNPNFFTCILNQYVGHWLILDALNSAITMSYKVKDEMHLRLSFESFMDDVTIFFRKLTTLAFNIKSKVFGVLDFFPFILKNI